MGTTEAISSGGESTLDWIDVRSEARAKAGLTRRLRPRQSDSTDLDLASNDYLGLARDKRVAGAAAAATLKWGAGSTGSRLVTGSTELHAELEFELANFCGSAVRAGLLQRLRGEPRRGHGADRPRHCDRRGPAHPRLSDRRHAPVQGRRRRRGPLRRRARSSTRWRPAARGGRSSSPTRCSRSTVTSHRSTSCTRPAGRNGAALIVDDAHGLGVVGPGGRGAVAEAGIIRAPDVITTLTLSKSLGARAVRCSARAG